MKEILKNMFKNFDEIKICENCKEPLGEVITLLGKEKIVPIMCSCRKNELSEQKKRLAFEENKNKIDLLISSGLMDIKYLDNTFENDNGSNKKITALCKKYVEQWAVIKQENIGILFYGDVGRGKTYFATSIANELFKKNVSICVTSLPKLLDMIAKFDEESNNNIRKVTQVSLMVIDDFGVERNTEFANEQIFKIFDDRLRTGKPTIVTTNLSKENLEKPQNITEKRIYSRLLEMCPIKLLIENEDNRTSRILEKINLARKILEIN